MQRNETGFSGQIKEYFWLFKKARLSLFDKQRGRLKPPKDNRCRVISSDQRRRSPGAGTCGEALARCFLNLE